MRTNRPYVQIDPDLLERVRQIDLLSYLREFEPSNLVTALGIPCYVIDAKEQIGGVLDAISSP